MDLEAHAVAMFDAGSDLKSKSDEEILYQDFKKFKSGDTTFRCRSGYIHECGRTEETERQDEAVS